MANKNFKSDKHNLYQWSVQDAECEVDFFSRVYNKLRNKKPRIVREDFCGTAQVCCEWVQRSKENKAHGIDLHKPTLDWGRKNNINVLPKEAASRVNLIQRDVRDRFNFKADVILALNFSYFIFKERKTLIKYAKSVRTSLAAEGIFVLDIHGGPDAQRIQEEKADYGDFTYIWDQASFNPVTGETVCHIHFELPDQKTMKRAFTYNWRLWTLPEMNDILMEAGFKTVDVYWEGTNQKTGYGNGVFRKSRVGDDSVSWIAYIVASK